jgi:diacylglycerol kinase family enzyme
VLLIVNAEASRVSQGTRAGVVSALAERHRVDVVTPASAEEATALANEAASSGAQQLVVAFGGDGTVSAAARGLIGTGVPLACIPGGYTNVFARTIGVPRNPVQAAAHIATLPLLKAPRSITLGTIDGRPFLFAAGIGFSAALMERLDAAGGLKNGFGAGYAVWQVAALAARAISGDVQRLSIDAGGREVEGVAAMAQNSDPLTFLGPRPIRICPYVDLGEKGISVTGLQSARVRDVARLAAGALSGRCHSVVAQPRLSHWPIVREARVHSLDADGLPVEADGDYLGRRHTIELGVSEAKLLLLA